MGGLRPQKVTSEHLSPLQPLHLFGVTPCCTRSCNDCYMLSVICKCWLGTTWAHFWCRHHRICTCRGLCNVYETLKHLTTILWICQMPPYNQLLGREGGQTDNPTWKVRATREMYKASRSCIKCKGQDLLLHLTVQYLQSSIHLVKEKEKGKEKEKKRKE